MTMMKQALPVNKNDTVTLDIIGLTHEGEGVGRVDGFTLFVQGALPGERVSAKVLKVKKTYGYAKQLELLQASPHRVDAPCPIYKQCGGCQLQHMSYEAQLVWKRQHVIDSLQRIGKLEVQDSNRGDSQLVADGNAAAAGQTSGLRGILVHPTIGMDEPWRYRNKAQVPIGMAMADLDSGAAGSLIGGFYARGSHRIVDMDACLIQHENNDAAVRQVKSIGNRVGISAYDETTGRGILRHVVVRTGFVTGEMMVVLVTSGPRIPRLEDWIAGIREALPQVKSIVQNINKRQTNVIFGDETRTLWGSDVIYDELDGLRFAISARSFYQVNPAQTLRLYQSAVDYAGLTGSENVIDAYCGIGTISLFLARRAGNVYGVEIVPEAIEDAKRNAELNGITNASFEAGPAEVVIPRWRSEGVTPDVIVVDPPRKGCDEQLLDTILKMQPERVVYVSCNPATLARDLQVLEAGGYQTVEVQPVDMFPHTSHVESVCLLVKD
ncbi:23S rRNA (uracil(1939)-C(5))-methyltransferase RlmD [Paenibacillus herberti]|uniref:23S rRNA (Uracil(1939)-C(5))-methyltransferase RlmD n=1 Tax=Paenibacillus herberti TaxID=1619309 RepID=A0A229NYE6_9BACL|nr:23S rRNA (uracil(1939)-C(5))-methyltransferase RlmD [Paenibacillus herberti]OXM15046.1 23S rRNA (uracil(1939)-C(5))-methyltransferase RlmD [Paenibacillus herberti]